MTKIKIKTIHHVSLPDNLTIEQSWALMDTILAGLSDDNLLLFGSQSRNRRAIRLMAAATDD